VKEGGDHILKTGESAPLLVLVECVGPAGSGLPSLKAVAEPELGLTAASGDVTIPALSSGQTAVIRVPRVTAGADPTGMYRLRLKIQDGGAAARAIVVEGRIGFSKLTGSLSSQSQLFLSPGADHLISGKLGRSMLLDTNTLRSQWFNLPTGLGLAGAAFSPDGGHVALALINPQDKKGIVVISDNTFGKPENLPAGSAFVRWWGKDQILLTTPHGLVRHSISGAPDYVFPTSEAWSAADTTRTVIPGTDIQFFHSPDGKVGVKKGSEPVREILQGTRVKGFAAVADDLSAFGGVDEEKHLWVQRGFDAKPEIVASQVERVIWGPVSRRAVVQDAANHTRVYDSRNGTWIDLGAVSGVQWSPDEERLLYVETSSQYLSLLTGRRVERICHLNRLGLLAQVAFAADGNRAFVLAGVAGPLDVWEVALPPRTSK
jgi:hypothetical protein